MGINEYEVGKLWFIEHRIHERLKSHSQSVSDVEGVSSTCRKSGSRSCSCLMKGRLPGFSSSKTRFNGV